MLDLIEEIKKVIMDMEKGDQFDSSNLIEEGSRTKFVLHFHRAEVAGDHADLRILVKDSGDAPVWSFALPKAKIPDSNKDKKLAIRTPDHAESWVNNYKGYISTGYGKGEVEIVQDGECIIHKLSERKIQFSIKDSNGPLNGTYYLILTDPEKRHYLFFKSKEQLI